MGNNVHFSSESDEWETPQNLFDELNEEFNFCCDMAATEANRKCEEWCSDSLAYTWKELAGHTPNRFNWCNPPYSRGKMKLFLQKAYEGMQEGVKSVFLIPARTDTKAWHDYIWDEENYKPRAGVEVRLVKGRIKFEKDGKPVLDKNGKPQAAPFPSAIVIFRGE